MTKTDSKRQSSYPLLQLVAMLDDKYTYGLTQQEAAHEIGSIANGVSEESAAACALMALLMKHNHRGVREASFRFAIQLENQEPPVQAAVATFKENPRNAVIVSDVQQ